MTKCATKPKTPDERRAEEEQQRKQGQGGGGGDGAKQDPATGVLEAIRAILDQRLPIQVMG